MLGGFVKSLIHALIVLLLFIRRLYEAHEEFLSRFNTVLPILTNAVLLCMLGHLSACAFYFFSMPDWRTDEEVCGPFLHQVGPVWPQHVEGKCAGSLGQQCMPAIQEGAQQRMRSGGRGGV